MTLKLLATGVAGATAIGAAATGATSAVPVSQITAEVAPVVFDAPAPAGGWFPLPQQPAPDTPSAGELITVLTKLADPGIPFANKSELVEGGISPLEANVADKRMQKAAQTGQMPLSFGVENIAPSGPGAATADVTASGPKLEPRTLNMMFVDRDGWLLSRSSAMALLQAAGAS